MADLEAPGFSLANRSGQKLDISVTYAETCRPRHQNFTLAPDEVFVALNRGHIEHIDVGPIGPAA